MSGFYEFTFEAGQGQEELAFASLLPNCNVFPLLSMGPNFTCSSGPLPRSLP